MFKIDDKAKFTEVYHLIMKASECYSRISMNIPRSLLEVQQHIHGYNAYQSIATRKGMFVRYHGIRVAHRWFNSIPLSVRKDIRMNTDTSTVWLGHSQDVKLNKGGLLCID